MSLFEPPDVKIYKDSDSSSSSSSSSEEEGESNGHFRFPQDTFKTNLNLNRFQQDTDVPKAPSTVMTTYSMRLQEKRKKGFQRRQETERSDIKEEDEVPKKEVKPKTEWDSDALINPKNNTVTHATVLKTKNVQKHLFTDQEKYFLIKKHMHAHDKKSKDALELHFRKHIQKNKSQASSVKLSYTSKETFETHNRATRRIQNRKKEVAKAKVEENHMQLRNRKMDEFRLMQSKHDTENMEAKDAPEHGTMSRVTTVDYQAMTATADGTSRAFTETWTGDTLTTRDGLSTVDFSGLSMGNDDDSSSVHTCVSSTVNGNYGTQLSTGMPATEADMKLYEEYNLLPLQVFKGD